MRRILSQVCAVTLSLLIAATAQATAPVLSPQLTTAFHSALGDENQNPTGAPVSWLTSRGSTIIVHWSGCGGDEGDFATFQESDFVNQSLDVGFTTLVCQNTTNPRSYSRWNLAEGYRINAQGRRVH